MRGLPPVRARLSSNRWSSQSPPAAVKKLKVGNGFEPGVLQGPLIDQAAVEKVEEHILTNTAPRGISSGNHGTTRSQRRSGFSRDHGGWKIPRSHSGTDPDGLFNDHQTAIIPGRWNGVSINPLGLLGEPLNKGSSICDFAHCFAHRFTLF